MLEPKEKVIDEFKVMVTSFPARYGFKLQAKLLRIFGPVIGELVSGMKGKKESASETDVNLSGLSTSIEKLFDSLDEDKAEKLVFELLQSTRINGQEVTATVFDEVFQERYDTLYKTIGFVLEVNYGSFFGKSGIGQALKNLTHQK